MGHNVNILPNIRARGRGTAGVPKSRFDIQKREWFDDGWDIVEEAQVLRTLVTDEPAKSAISYSSSPDLSFDRSINTYRGCEHGCVYCYARPSHNYLDLSSGLDFETKLFAKTGIVDKLRRELARPKYQVAPIAIGTNTDPYQAIEGRYQTTRQILEVMLETLHPVAIVTKGSMIERDIDLLASLAAQGLTRVGISVTSLDRTLSRRMEPRAPDPKRRLAVIQRLSDAGIPVRVMASPMIPGLSDHELEAIMQAGRDHGATSASWIMLRLPHDTGELFEDWLTRHYPNRLDRVMRHMRAMYDGKLYDASFATRMRGRGVYAETIQMRFQLAMKRLGLAERVAKLRSDLFVAPRRPSAQGDLFD
ncbi:MAG: PA0069 family radical SAM protein [Paracoccaceae bacterium]